MQITAKKLIDQSAKLAGVLGVGTELSASEYDDCLLQLNSLIERWNLADLLVYTTNPHDFDFIPGKQYYNLGAGGDFDMPRPAKIDRVSILYGDQTAPIEFTISAETDVQAWQSIMLKSVTSTFPLVMYNNTDYPYMNLGFWPIPSTATKVRLYTWDNLDTAASLNDTLDYPMGYSDALMFNLALRICQLFDRQPTQFLIREALTSKNAIDDINSGSPTLMCDGTLFNRAVNNQVALQSMGRVVL